MNILDNIKLRRSVRTFRKEALNGETKSYITNYLKEHTNTRGPFGHKVNLFEIDISSPKQLGTYGVIKNPDRYIAGTCEKTDQALIDFGYIFEKMILDFTKVEIGTCWLAGTFKRAEFEKYIEKDDLQLMPAVTPIGYFDDKRTFETVMRKVIKADNRIDFGKLFYQEGFDQPLSEEKAFMFNEPLNAVRLGPSASNKQPWRVVISKDLKACHFYLEKTPNYSKALGFNVQMIDMGIAMFHFEVSCDQLNIEGQWVDEEPNIQLPNEQFEYIMTFK